MCYNSLFFFECYCDHRYLSVLSHSVPTRRPSDRPSSAGRLCASSAGSPSARCCGTALAVWDVVVVPVDALFGVAPSARTPGCGALVPGGAIVVAVCARASPRREASWPGFRCALAFAFACAGGACVPAVALALAWAGGPGTLRCSAWPSPPSALCTPLATENRLLPSWWTTPGTSTRPRDAGPPVFMLPGWP